MDKQAEDREFAILFGAIEKEMAELEPMDSDSLEDRTEESLIYGKGKILIITSGSYSDYEIHYVLRVLKEFNFEEENKKFHSNYYRNWEERYPCSELRAKFVMYLEKEGYVEDADYEVEWFG